MLTFRRVSDDTRRAANAAHQMVGLDLRPTYHVHYENVAEFVADPFGWFIWVVDVPDVWATASSEDGIEAAARAVIAAALDVPKDAFDLVTQRERRHPAE
jgi:hypothetical protein